MGILQVVAFVLGIVLLLFSRRIFESAIFLMGAFIGFIISMSIDYSLQVVSSGNAYSPSWLLSLIVALASGAMARFIHSLMIFLLGFALGILLSMGAGIYLESGLPWTVIGVVGGIPLGFLALKAEKFFFILITTFLAANIIVIDVHLTLSQFGILGGSAEFPADYYNIMDLIFIIVVTISGILFQFGSHRNKHAERVFLAAEAPEDKE